VCCNKLLGLKRFLRTPQLSTTLHSRPVLCCFGLAGSGSRSGTATVPISASTMTGAPPLDEERHFVKQSMAAPAAAAARPRAEADVDSHLFSPRQLELRRETHEPKEGGAHSKAGPGLAHARAHAAECERAGPSAPETFPKYY